MTPADDAKARARGRMLARRRRLAAAAAARAGERVSRRIASIPWFRGAGTVAVYAARGGEVPVDGAARAARAGGRRVAYPRVVRGRRALAFHLVDDASTLRRGAFGIAEPVPALHPRVPLRAIDVFVVPLVAFDPACNRIGSGRGHYDATLAAATRRRAAAGAPPPRAVGAAHAFQRIAVVVAGPHDVVLDAVATPAGLARAPGVRARPSPRRPPESL